jgi:hypothetical protein
MEAVNLFRAEAMTLARSLDDFLAAAPRTPVTTGSSFGSTAYSSQPADLTKPTLDEDALDAFNSRMPLATLAAAARSEVLPLRLRRFVASEGLARAIILQNDQVASQLAALLSGLSPEVAGDLKDVVNAPTARERHYAGVLFLLRYASVSAMLQTETTNTYDDAGLSRGMSHQGGNWWCAFDPAAPESPAPGSGDLNGVTSTVTAVVVGNQIVFPEFITPADRRALAAEWITLSRSDVAPVYLANEAVAWANASPRDERAAEALALAVEGTRWGCTSRGPEANGPASQRAFQTLHRLFPNSSWAKQTKYWYRGN